MTQTVSKSDELRNAELTSERVRIWAVVWFMAIFIIVIVMREFVMKTAARNTPWRESLLLAAVIIVYELWTLRRVGLCLSKGVGFPTAFWIISTVVETSIPAIVLAFLASSEIPAGYRPIASPAVLVFCIFIILSTLRLNFWIGALSGISASVSYLCAALYLGWRPPLPGNPVPATQSAVTLNALIILVAGIVAGRVAIEIRKYVKAAVREAETKRKLELVEHDLHIARSIQQALLPQQDPQICGFEIAGWNRPADDTGGDYFDWNTLPNGKVVVSMADVTGHGIGPALLASACHAYARSNFNTAPDLPTALERINQELGADLSTGCFVTFAAAVCCPGNSEVEMLSAGQGPLFVYNRPQDRFIELNAQGLPFGILPSFHSDPPAHIQLDSGDLVLFATDGFMEWENEAGEQFGMRRVEDVIRASRDLASAEIISKLYQSVVAFSNGTRQQDDVTAVIIKRL